MPRPINQENCPGEVPHVTMTKSEAVALSQALMVARSMFVERIGKIGRSKADALAKKNAVGQLRAELASLQAFHEAHELAHGIGGN